MIYKCEIRQIKQTDISSFSVYALYVKGSAFLWHQIRCMFSILYKIGKSEEPPSYIDYMLDISKCTKRPLYELASERPLILANCGFEDVTFRNTFSGNMKAFEELRVSLFC